MKLKALLKDLTYQEVKGSKETEITGISSNSKTVTPGNLFISKRCVNQQQYLTEAIRAGASAIVIDMYDPFIKEVVQIITPEPNLLEPLLATKYYQYPSKDLLVVGITGTSGKTTISFLVKQLLDQIALPCGVIGTIKYHLGKVQYPASHTTPDIVTNQRLLKEMLDHGCQAVSMEVSSHGLDQKRVEGIEFDIAIFTNLSQDHLDYHLSMEAYATAKAKLFALLGSFQKKKWPKKAIINRDDPISEKMIQACKVPIVTYGLSDEADVYAKQLKLTAAGSNFLLCFKEFEIAVRTNLVGEFNVYNCLAVAALGITLGLSLEQLAKLIGNFLPIEGRLEKVDNSLGLHIYVDYAHKPDALKKVLENFAILKTGRVITIFGCGGNRDKIKRPQMAAISEKFSDITIVTSDNPRQENPEDIINQIITGFSDSANYIVELDRYKAIEKAIQLAHPDDIILIAGKGHETYQIFANKTIDFDDRLIAQQICRNTPLIPR